MWWKIALAIVGGVLGLMVLAAVVGAVILLRYRKEQPSKKETMSPEGGEPLGRALIIYQPGGSGFTERVAYALGQGLCSLKWEVVLDRPNRDTERKLDSYDLLCIGSPTWAARPLPPVMTYVDSCEGLEGRPAGVFATGGENPWEASKIMAAALEKRGAKVLGRLDLLTKQDGEETKSLTEAFAGKLIRSVSE